MQRPEIGVGYDLFLHSMNRIELPVDLNIMIWAVFGERGVQLFGIKSDVITTNFVNSTTLSEEFDFPCEWTFPLRAFSK
jgi:hypothetical protein